MDDMSAPLTEGQNAYIAPWRWATIQFKTSSSYPSGHRQEREGKKETARNVEAV